MHCRRGSRVPWVGRGSDQARCRPELAKKDSGSRAPWLTGWSWRGCSKAQLRARRALHVPALSNPFLAGPRLARGFASAPRASNLEQGTGRSGPGSCQARTPSPHPWLLCKGAYSPSDLPHPPHRTTGCTHWRSGGSGSAAGVLGPCPGCPAPRAQLSQMWPPARRWHPQTLPRLPLPPPLPTSSSIVCAAVSRERNTFFFFLGKKERTRK